MCLLVRIVDSARTVRWALLLVHTRMIRSGQ
jgi:hypothetical protein